MDYLFDIDVWYLFIIDLIIVVMKIREHVPTLLFFLIIKSQRMPNLSDDLGAKYAYAK